VISVPQKITQGGDMRIAITGATGFVGAHLTERLEHDDHELVLIARRQAKDTRVVATDLSDVKLLSELFAGCKSIAHCAGINREIGSQTYRRVHLEAHETWSRQRKSPVSRRSF
jgi:NADH dehydrogenase